MRRPSRFYSGSFVFLLCINDLPHASKLTRPLLFADDTRIFYSHFDLIELQSTLNDELCNYYMWLKSNKLSVNVKTIVMSSLRKKQIISVLRDNLSLYHLLQLFLVVQVCVQLK